MPVESLPAKLARQVVLGDGAMGTMLYQRGAFLNTSFDELNLTRPDWVADIHRAYVDAGADFIETNTFGAGEIKLARFGLADQVEAINTAAVRLARAAAGDQVMVAGAVGPLGVELPPYGRFSPQEAARAFARQARALAAAGIDFFILETFSHLDELLLAVDAAHRIAPDLPIVAQLTTNQNHETIYGVPLEQAVARLDREPAVTVLGLNCSIGPSAMLRSLELIHSLTDKPISIQPNAGLPRAVEDRRIYMSTPEYMAEYAKRFFEKGARIIGGCCGTTPEHIRQIVRAVRPLDKAATAVIAAPLGSPEPPTTTLQSQKRPAASASAPAAPAEPQATVPLAEKSRLGAKLAAREPILTIEVTPPRGFDLSTIAEKARLCADLGVDALNIPDGPRASSRLSPLVTALKIQQAADLETILHVCCRDRNLIGMQSDMLGAYAMGLSNLLLITGDPPKLGDFPDATAVFDLDSIGLTRVVHNLNRGIDIAGNTFSPPLALTIAVGANPVAADLEREIERFKKKVDAGAEYAITQPVFDIRMLRDFLDATRSHRIPIVAGIWPFTSYKNAEFMANEVPGVVVPPALLQRMSQARTREQGRRLGIEIAREMIDAIAPHVAGFAVSAPFGNVRTALAVAGKLDPDAA